MAAKYGAGEVEAAALDVLGFPVLLVSTGSEIVTIRDYLTRTVSNP